MLSDPLFLIVGLACLVVLGILVMGIGNFGKGGESHGKRSNQLMRWRIIAQFVAVILILIFVTLRGGN